MHRSYGSVSGSGPLLAEARRGRFHIAPVRLPLRTRRSPWGMTQAQETVRMSRARRMQCRSSRPLGVSHPRSAPTSYSGPRTRGRRQRARPRSPAWRCRAQSWVLPATHRHVVAACTRLICVWAGRVHGLRECAESARASVPEHRVPESRTRTGSDTDKGRRRAAMDRSGRPASGGFRGGSACSHKCCYI